MTQIANRNCLYSDVEKHIIEKRDEAFIQITAVLDFVRSFSSHPCLISVDIDYTKAGDSFSPTSTPVRPLSPLVFVLLTSNAQLVSFEIDDNLFSALLWGVYGFDVAKLSAASAQI